ncbi:hypothetical protein M408DRAFT_12113 [Serendipita vermifera MAFF 305830]|uniref:F-box domain-containing protein n=1 Tax=Serendipita vermifera MAFF 305830 TaxID=933852 RepID=A0A0C3ACB0_SERVB|nr:hypothetical protein M408DRAFT_12113 [Serendipita vermifera MAFF 305830]
MSNTTRFSDPIKAHELQGRSNALLETIYATDIKSDLPLDETKVLKQEYNHVSRQLDQLTYSILPDPLVILPPELWGDILYEATRNEDTFDPPPVEASLILTLVNADWCTKILDTPRLWTVIELGKGHGDVLANLETALRLSKDLELNITIHFMQAEWLIGFPLLARHRHRIRRLTLLQRNKDRLALWPYDFVDQFFSIVGPLSSLQLMDDDFSGHSQFNWEYILSQCPALIGVERHLDAISPSGHEQFWVHHTNSQLKYFLFQLKDLVHVRILRWWPNMGIEEDIHIADHDIPPLPALKHFVIGCDFNHILYTVLNSAKNLTYLSVSIGDKWRHVFDLLELLTHLPKLSYLNLTISSIFEQLSMPVLCPVATNIRGLGVGHVLGQYDKSPNIDTLFLLLPGYFKHLQELSMSSINLGPNLVAFVASLSCLRSLDLGKISLYNIENMFNGNCLIVLLSSDSMLDRKALRLKEDFSQI